MTPLARIPVPLLRAATAVAAAVLILLGALTLQNLAGHSDEAVSTLTTAVQQPATETVVGTHVDGSHGVEMAVCALMGLVVLLVTAVAAVRGITSGRGALLHRLARALAAFPAEQSPTPTGVSLTRLSIARI